MQGIITIIADLVKLLAGLIGNTLKKHWGKIILCVLWTFMFITLLFPYGDLTSLASKYIYQATGIGTRIGNMGFAMNPSPGIKLTDLQVNVASPPLSFGAVSVYPSILSSLLNQDAYMSADIEQSFGGNIQFTRSPGEAVADAGYNKEAIELNVSNVKIVEVLNALKHLTITNPIALPVKLSGSVDLQTAGSIDPKFSEQPEVEFTLSGKNIEFPPQSVPTTMGPISFPKIKWSEMNLRGRLVAGDLIIEDGLLGKKGDPLYMKLKGKVALKIDNKRGRIQPLPGRYELDIDLNMTQSVDSVIGLLLTPIAGNYKTPWTTGQGSTYTFRASGTNFRGPPKTKQLRTF